MQYLTREFGNDVPYASIAAINWSLCAVLPQIVQARPAKRNGRAAR
jgi:hypothetical protein